MGLTPSEYASLMDKNVSLWVMEQYAMQPVVYPRLVRMVTPGDFGVDSSAEFIKTATGIFSGPLRERMPGQEFLSQSGGEDYERLMKIRQVYDQVSVTEEYLKTLTTEAAVADIKALAVNWGNELARTKESAVANYFINGATTAGSLTYYDQSVVYGKNLANDPYPKYGYDNVPWFDTAHPLSKQVTGTTVSNHASTYSFSYDNLQSAWTQYTDTMAYDGRGNHIQQVPSVLLYGPALSWSVKETLRAPGDPGSANLRSNVFADMSLQQIEWRYISGSNDASISVASTWFLLEPGDLYMVDEWRPTQTKTYIDEGTGTVHTKFQAWYGLAHMNWRKTLACYVAAA